MVEIFWGHKSRFVRKALKYKKAYKYYIISVNLNLEGNCYTFNVWLFHFFYFRNNDKDSDKDSDEDDDQAKKLKSQLHSWVFYFCCWQYYVQ